MFVPPAMAAQQLQNQASQQLAAGTAMTRLPSAAPVGLFNQQFQQQFQGIQAQQSYNPYMAQALSGNMLGAGMGAMGGYSPGMLPSPLMMTPPSTGAFRPMPQLSMSPIPPQQVAPIMPGPFVPRLPQPMFQTAWDRELQQRDFREDKLYSMASQAPRGMGMAAGFGAGAAAGAAVGGMFGGVGRVVGALGGGALAGISGFAGSAGEMAMSPMRPSLDVHEMGASLQRMSQQWMLTGPQMHQQGAGFSRLSSLHLADQIRTMSTERGFKAETGEAFNREDLMKITEQSGRAGLMDMEQGTEAVRNNLRQVSRVIRRFMQLTGDPDVVSVIREMGQMRAFGMSVNDMERAAQNMKSYARAAGVSVQGLQQMGGVPGAMTYTQVGLSAASGMEMGNYAFAAARQAVATGTYNPRELAMMGGVSGIAQRNVQAQAALTSMPLFGAAVGGYGQGGWGVNYGQLAQVARGGQGGLGATGMVMGAVQNIGQAVAQGGIGALAEFPIRQRFLQEQAAQSMHPAQQMAMRFKMAMQTGQTLGLQGKAAFTTGARALYGDEVAEQMFMEARNPQAFREQAAMLRRENQEIAREQRASVMSNAPGFADTLGRRLGISTSTRGVFTGGGSIGNALSDLGTSFSHNALFHYFEDVEARKNGERINRVSALAGIETEAQRRNVVKAVRGGLLQGSTVKRMAAGARGAEAEIGMAQAGDVLSLANAQLGDLMADQQTGARMASAVAGVAAFIPIPPLSAAMAGMSAAMGVMGQEGMTAKAYMEATGGTENYLPRTLQEAEQRNFVITASRNVTTEGIRGMASAVGKRFGVGEDKMVLSMGTAASELAKLARGKVALVGQDKNLSMKDVTSAIFKGLTSTGMSASQATEMIKGMSREQLAQYTGTVMRDAQAQGGTETAAIFQRFKDQAGLLTGGGVTGKKLEEDLAARAAGYERMAGWGEEGDVGAMTIRGKAREYSTEEFLGLAYAAAESDERREEIVKLAKESGVKDITGFTEAGKARFRGLGTQEAKEAMTALVKGNTAEQLAGFSKTKLREAGFGSFKLGARKLGKSLGIAGLGGETGDFQSVFAELATTSNISKLSKSEATKDLAGLLDKYRTATGTAKDNLEAQLQGALSEMGSQDFKPGDTLESLSEAEGTAADQNRTAADSLEGLAETLEDVGFDDFKAGAVDFLEGAKKLKEAMETETMSRVLDEVKEKE